MEFEADDRNAPQNDGGVASLAVFDRVRSQVNSGLENQRKAAHLLIAIENTIKQQNEPCVPLSYFGALMTLLEQQNILEDQERDESYDSMVMATAHLLSLVFPRIPTNILRLKFGPVSTTISEALQANQSLGPLMRDLTSCVETLLMAQDLGTWSSATKASAAPIGRAANTRSLFLVLLIMCLDERPKVRKRAQDGLRRLITRPPPPAMTHPASVPTLEFFIQQITDFCNVGSIRKDQKRERENNVLHVLVYLTTILPAIAIQSGDDSIRSKIGELCDLLLTLPVKMAGSSSTVVTQWVFQVLESLFSPPSQRVQSDDPFPHLSISVVDPIVHRLVSIKPYFKDMVLSPIWLSLVNSGFICLARLQERKAGDDVSVNLAEYSQKGYPKLLQVFWNANFSAFFSGNVKKVMLEPARILFSNLVSTCLTEGVVGGVRNPSDALRDMLSTLEASLTNIHFHDGWGSILGICESAIGRLGAEHAGLIHNLVSTCINIRDNPSYMSDFPFKAELESVLEMAALVMGLDRFSAVAPLSIITAEESETRRPYLLSIFLRALDRQPPNNSDGIRLGKPNMSYFTFTLLPLYHQLTEKIATAQQKESVAVKLFETLALQAISIFPVLCLTVPSDVAECFDYLAPSLATLLQSDYDVKQNGSDVRPFLYTGLQALVEGLSKMERELDETNERHMETLDLIAAGLSKLRSKTTNFLTILCNTYTTPTSSLLSISDSRGAVLQSLHERGQKALEKCIAAFLSIADEKAVRSYFFNLVKGVLQIQASLEESARGKEENDMEEDSESTEFALKKLRLYAMLDLLTVMISFLPEARELAAEEITEVPNDSPLVMFYNLLSGQLRVPDSTLQKKTYKALCLLVSIIPLRQLPLKELMEQIFDPEVLAITATGSKRHRMELIQSLVEFAGTAIEGEEQQDLESLLLEYIPIALSEVMLTTKEASEKARTAAFECLVSMGRKMLDVGIKHNRDVEWENERHKLAELAENRIQAMDHEDTIVARNQLSLKEFILMAVAGLAGSTAPMQSATIASLGRLLFEFHDSLELPMIKQLVSTVLMFMNSPNREIFKACLGFIKVAAVALPQEFLEDELETMVVSMLSPSSHKSHFKSKIRHILERLIRRFSLEAVQGFVPEADSRLIANIRKRRERLKKKKALAAKRESEDEEDPRKASLKAKKLMQSRQKEFEDALNDSESELGDSGDEAYIPESLRGVPKIGKSSRPAPARIREDDDIVDFLDSNVVSKVTTGTANKRQAVGSSTMKKRKEDFSVSADGRLVFADSDEEKLEAKMIDQPATRGEDYYMEAMTGEGAFKRLPDGRIKFLKRPRAAEDLDIGDDEVDEPQKAASRPGHQWGSKFGAHGKNKQPRLDESTKATMLGKQYQATRAKGDIKRPNMPDPYAYIPLSGKIVGNMKKSTQLSTDMKSLIKITKKGGDIPKQKQPQQKRVVSTKKGNKKHK
ncbi:armadillo-type protein [Zopfochytrium polystomum]|nr:armadillo-type protein [Zopfochytrium polystomum]